MNSNKILKDSLSLTDSCKHASHRPTLWAKTQVMGGYGIHTNSMGISALDEVVFETENMVPIGGVQYAMESLFGVKGPLAVPSLYELMQIGVEDSLVKAKDGEPHPEGQHVCLFGVGTTGAAENNLTALDVKYNEYNVSGMVPLRFTSMSLGADEGKYFGVKMIGDTKAYYLKKFENEPVIRHLYLNGVEGEDGTEVEGSIFQQTGPIQAIESFTEMTLTISRKDVREWFKHNGEIEQAHINSLGLYTAVYNSSKKDYSNIRLFSKLNIPTEPLSLTKDMNIIYRVYGA